MLLLLYKQMKFETDHSQEEFVRLLQQHTEFSKTKSFFSATTDDYAIKSEVRGGEIVLIDKFGRRRSRITVKVTSGSKTTITVRIVPRVFMILQSLLFILFILIVPFPMPLKITFIGLIYLVALIGFGLEVWWTNDLFQKKLLRNTAPH
jgi:hypothetical protein